MLFEPASVQKQWLLRQINQHVYYTRAVCRLALIECNVRCSVERKHAVHSGTVRRMQIAANPPCYDAHGSD